MKVVNVNQYNMFVCFNVIYLKTKYRIIYKSVFKLNLSFSFATLKSNLMPN